jgi:Flp pilus assembly protein TadG
MYMMNLTESSPGVVVDARSVVTRLIHRIRNKEDGGSLVEFAVVLPMLMLVMTGMMTFALALSSYLQLIDSTRVGAQYLGISRLTTTDPCATAVGAISSSASTLTASSLSYSFVINGVSYPKVTSCASATANMVQGAAAQVTVTYPCSLAVYGVNYVPNCTLTAQTTELIQ